MNTTYNTTMTNAELVTVYNSLVEDSKRITVWKKSKDELLARLDAVQLTPTQRSIRKARAMSKSMQLLDLLLDVEGNVAELEFVINDLETTEGSVRSYVSYFRTGKKGHPIIALQITHGLVMFVDDAAKAKAIKVMDDLRATFNK